MKKFKIVHTLSKKLKSIAYFGFIFITVVLISSCKKEDNPIDPGTNNVSEWKFVTARTHTAALKSDNTLWGWGTIITNSFSPKQIGNSLWKEVSSGYDHSVAINYDGTLWGWGWNNFYQVGDGTNENRIAPTQISSSSDWAQVSAGVKYSFALKTNGSLWAWGTGNLGTGTSSSQSATPTMIGSAMDWKIIRAGGSHSLGLRNNGTLWAWGENLEGQLGNNTNTASFSPIQVGNSNDWENVWVGEFHTVAIKTNGSIWTWGSNGFGQLGDGSFQSKNFPIQIGNSEWAIASAGYRHTIAVKSNGTLWSWGDNSRGELGNGTNIISFVPIQEISYSNNWNFVTAGFSCSFGIKNDKTLWAWGSGSNGQLGDGDIQDRSAPVQIH